MPPRPWTLALVMTAAAVAAAGRAHGYGINLSKGLVEAMAVRFGPAARPRLASWSGFLRSEMETVRVVAGDASGQDRVLLDRVNRHFNHIPFVDDPIHWGTDDYWASPAETVASNGADCEDFAVAKYFALKELGVPTTRLRITYVRATSINRAHMVLAYYATPGADPLILDNLTDEIRTGSQRPDLLAVYSFNDDDVRLGRPGGDSRAGRSTQIRRWRELLEKMDQEARL